MKFYQYFSGQQTISTYISSAYTGTGQPSAETLQFPNVVFTGKSSRKNVLLWVWWKDHNVITRYSSYGTAGFPGPGTIARPDHEFITPRNITAIAFEEEFEVSKNLFIN